MSKSLFSTIDLAPTLDTGFRIASREIRYVDDEEKFDEKLPASENGLQKENRYNLLLPYDIKAERYQNLTRIKANIAKAIECDQSSLYSWIEEFQRYLDLYGLAFTKEDHIHFIKLFYELLVTSKDLCSVIYLSRCLTRLLEKRYLISRDELVLDWKPLYDLCKRTTYNNKIRLGLRCLPSSTINIDRLIVLSNAYFSLESTQEMLDEWRPMVCPYDHASSDAIYYMSVFLPRVLPPEHHDKGFKLWFQETMDFWLDSKKSSEVKSIMTYLLSRVSFNCIGYIDWEPYIPQIFTRFKAWLNLTLCFPGLDSDEKNCGHFADWIVYMLGGGSSCQKHLFMLFKAIESFYHPSNANGRWQGKLQRFAERLPSYFIKRIFRERYKKHKIPESHKLTDDDITQFVKSIVPIVLTSMFNHSGVNYAASAFKDLALLRPELVIPPLLERLYGSYETLTEPQRFLSSINCMTAVVPALVRPCKYYPDGPNHVVPLLLNSLPGIDTNDMRKTLTVLRFVSTLCSYIELKDYAYLVDERSDLTYEQQQLCLATGQFENFVIQFLDKCFVLIENSSSASFAHVEQENELKNKEEGIIEAAICSVTLSILSQSSDQILDAALDKLYSHVSRHIFDTKTKGKAIASLCLAFVKSYPKPTLAKFVPHFSRLILTLTDHDDVFNEQVLDDELLFSLLLMSEIVRCHSNYLIEYKDSLMQVLKRALALSAKEGYSQGCAILRHLLRALTNIACHDWKNIKSKSSESATGKEWPFDNWGATTQLDELEMDWHKPGPDSRAFVMELLDTFLIGSLDSLRSWSQGSKKLKHRDEVRMFLHVILSCLIGSASVLPPLDSEKVELKEAEVPIEPFVIMNTGTEPLLLPDGSNVRNVVANAMKEVLRHVLTVTEDDAKSLYLICEILNTCMSYFGFSKSEYRLSSQRLQSMKKGLDNKLLGSRRYLRYMLVERVVQQHRAMLFSRGSPFLTKLHLEILDIMFSLATGHYIEVRILAQDTIYTLLEYFEATTMIVVNRIVAELSQSEIEHNKFKGLLYLLSSKHSKDALMVNVPWTGLKEIWPAVVGSPHSEKPSVVRLIDRLCLIVQKDFDTFALKIELDEKAKELARKIWSSVDTNLFKPFTEEELANIQKSVLEQNQKLSNSYTELVIRLVNLIELPSIHWHRKIVAFSLLSQLARDDFAMPLEALNLFLSCLVNDRLSIRKKSVELLAGQLKMHKRKHVKRPIDSQILASNDNSWLQYKLSDKFYTKEQWDSLVFIDKPHIGYLCWPKTLEVYDDYSKQPNLDWNYADLTPAEKAIYDKFTDEDFLDKLVEFFTFEENKGSDRFEVKRYQVFKGLFRNFGPKMIESFKKHVMECATSTCSRKEYKQRFAIEFLAGLIRGAKHWKYEWQLKVREFSETVLEAVSLTQENRTDWNMFIDYIFRDRDIRRIEWLLFYVIKKATFESELGNVTPYVQSSRLMLATSALCQCEWRATDEVFTKVMENLSTQNYLLAYANVRTQLAYIYAIILSYDNPNSRSTMSNTHKFGPKVNEFVSKILPQLSILEKGNKSTSSSEQDGDSNPPLSIDSLIPSTKQEEFLKKLTNVDATEEDKLMEASSSDPGGSERSEERKEAKKLLKLVCLWVVYYYYRTLNSVAPEIFQLLPVLCDTAGDSTDQELVVESKVATLLIGTVTLTTEAIDQALINIRKIITNHSWHARYSVASFLRLMVSSNLFVLMNNKQWVAEVKDIVINFLIRDERVEVREATIVTLSGLIHCNFIQLDEELIWEFKRRASSPLVRKPKQGTSSVFESASLVTRHSGILGLCACVEAYPYTVPDFLPDILIFLSDHLSDPQPISTTIKSTMSDFRRTHHDNWQSDKNKFTEDQLEIMADLLVSPSYYA